MEIQKNNSPWRYLYFYELRAYQYGYVLQENSEEALRITDLNKLYPISFHALLTLTHPVWHDSQIQDLTYTIVKLVSDQQPTFAYAKNYQIVQFSFVNKENMWALKLGWYIRRIDLQIKWWKLKLKRMLFVEEK